MSNTDATYGSNGIIVWGNAWKVSYLTDLARPDVIATTDFALLDLPYPNLLVVLLTTFKYPNTKHCIRFSIRNLQIHSGSFTRTRSRS